MATRRAWESSIRQSTLTSSLDGSFDGHDWVRGISISTKRALTYFEKLITNILLSSVTTPVNVVQIKSICYDFALAFIVSRSMVREMR